MKNIGIAFIFMLTIHCVTAQNEGLRLKDCGIDTARWIIGTEVSGGHLKVRDGNGNVTAEFYQNKIAPFAYYFFDDYFGLGLLVEYDYLISTFYSRDDLYGLGVLWRSYIDLPEVEVTDIVITDYVDMFIGGEYRFTNYYVQDTFVSAKSFYSKEIVYDQLRVNVIKLELGFNFYYLKPLEIDWLSGLNPSFAYRPEWYIGKNLYHNFIWRIEYRF